MSSVTVLHVSLFHTFLFTSSSIFLSSAVFLPQVKDEWLISGFQPVLLFLQQSLADHVFITTALDMSVYHVLSEGFCQGVRLKASTMKSNIQYIGTSAQSLITLIKPLDFKNRIFTGLFDRERICVLQPLEVCELSLISYSTVYLFQRIYSFLTGCCRFF